ncbi:hypothetical protein BT96DRAFT_776638, partial [Gymnopus androsaceus JB14]
LTIKTYLDTKTILGKYNESHNHEIGNANLRFTRISKETRELIAGLLRSGVSSDNILKHLHGDAYAEGDSDDSDDDENLANSSTPLSRNIFIRSRDIHREKKSIESEHIQLNQDDGQSTRNWAEKLQEKKHVGSGRCIPIAWMISNSGTEATLAYFLQLVHLRNPTVIPHIVMTDRDHAQINAVRRVYWEATILLCWWHVLHAWQQHFRIPDHLELWEQLKSWIRIKDRTEFASAWQEISRRAVEEFADSTFYNYLCLTWGAEDIVKMWSAVFCIDRSILEDCDTNMLIEAWHHQARQDVGFEGENLEVMKRRQVIRSSYEQYSIADIDIDAEEPAPLYLVQSKLDLTRQYEVDLEAYTCTCLDFPSIHFCKHLCAVQRCF